MTQEAASTVDEQKQAAKPYYTRAFRKLPKAWQDDIRELQRRGMLKTVMIWEYEQ